MEGHCSRCGTCCKVLTIDFNLIDRDEKWVEGRGGTINGNDVFIPSVCKWLTEDNLCAIHDEKPLWCRDYPENIVKGRDWVKNWLVNKGCGYYGKTT